MCTPGLLWSSHVRLVDCIAETLLPLWFPKAGKFHFVRSSRMAIQLKAGKCSSTVAWAKRTHTLSIRNREAYLLRLTQNPRRSADQHCSRGGVSKPEKDHWTYILDRLERIRMKCTSSLTRACRNSGQDVRPRDAMELDFLIQAPRNCWWLGRFSFTMAMLVTTPACWSCQ